jgi:hypothetical protein
MRVSFAQSHEYRTRITNTDGNSQILADGNDAHLIFGTSAGTTGATATEKMRILSSGRVGIGNTSPNATLDIHNVNGGNATTRAEMLSEAVLKLRPHATNSTNMLFSQVNGGSGMGITVTNGPTTANWDIALNPFGGNVGIGTVAPTVKLDVYNSTGAEGTTGTTMQRLWNYVGDLSQQKTFIDFVFQDTNDNQYPQVRIGAEVGQNGNADSTIKEGCGAFVVYTNNATNDTPGTNVLAERFRVDYKGDVGIGDSAPTAKLHVKSTGNAVLLKAQSAGYMSMDLWGATNGGLLSLYGGTNSPTLVLDGRPGYDSYFPRSVGIGNTIPLSRLDVSGVLAVRGANEDPNFTNSVTGFSTMNSGNLEINYGLGGTAANGATIVFRYNAASWKSWSLDYTMSSTHGMTSGKIAGYNNNNGGGQGYMDRNDLGVNVVATNAGQHVIVTFTFTGLGVHPYINMKYGQSGGDGSPRSDRASLTITN